MKPHYVEQGIVIENGQVDSRVKEKSQMLDCVISCALIRTPRLGAAGQGETLFSF